MGRAKEKILAHKKAREEAKNVEKQKNSKNMGKKTGEGDSISVSGHGNGKVGQKLKKGSSFISANPNYGPLKPNWRHGSSNDGLSEKNHSQLQLLSKEQGKVEVKVLTTPDFLSTDELRQLSDILPKFSLKQITPTVAAVALNRFDLVKKLIRDGNFDSDYNDKVLTPMGCALYLNNWEMINYFVEKRLYIHCKNMYATPLLVEAAMLDSWDIQQMTDLYRLVKDDPQLDLLSSNSQGLTICHVLAKKGWTCLLDQILPSEPLTRQCKKLLKKLLDVTTNLGVTPIMMAAENGHADTASYLIQRGANFSQEDKFGFTAFCRALRFMYDHVPLEDGSKPHPTVTTLVDAMNSPSCQLDVKNYITRRVQLMSNPSWDSHPNQGQVQVMYDLGRVPFFFYAAFIQNGVEELLNIRFMSRLVLGGQKYFSQTDYVVTISGIFFDFLVYTQQERAELYDQVVNNFVTEGGADFCSKVMQKNVTLPVVEPTSRNSGGGASVCSTSISPITEEDVESLFVSPVDDRNISMAGMLPFIQTFDHPKIQNWLAVHFTTVKMAYTTQREGPVFMFKCNLMLSHIRRLEANSLAWEKLWSQDFFVPYSDLINEGDQSATTNEFKKSQLKPSKKKRNRK